MCGVEKVLGKAIGARRGEWANSNPNTPRAKAVFSLGLAVLQCLSRNALSASGGDRCPVARRISRPYRRYRLIRSPLRPRMIELRLVRQNCTFITKEDIAKAIVGTILQVWLA